MKKLKNLPKIKLNGETIKALDAADLAQAAGAGYVTIVIKCVL